MDTSRQKTLIVAVFATALAWFQVLGYSAEPRDCAADTKASQERALRDIDDWATRMKKEDPRYVQIEDVLMRRIDFVTSAMPSQYWLPALQLMYATAAEASTPPKAPTLQRF